VCTDLTTGQQVARDQPCPVCRCSRISYAFSDTLPQFVPPAEVPVPAGLVLMSLGLAGFGAAASRSVRRAHGPRPLLPPEPLSQHPAEHLARVGAR
jgi:hypothetical protein